VIIPPLIVWASTALAWADAGTPSESTAPRIELLVQDQPKQVFLGFGASQPRDQSRLFVVYGNERVRALATKVYGELGMNWLRLWVASGNDQDVASMKTLFYKGYIDNGYLDILRAAGVKKLLLAPARGESPPAESMQSYAGKIAQFIYDIRQERGVKIDVTGIANEPAGFSAGQLNEATRALRAELNARGLGEVGIVSPECASPDGCAVKAIAAMKTDSATWPGLQGIATHSYNMGANASIEDLILGTGKEYWITEAGRALPRLVDEDPGDMAEAAGTAARFLNDMNHSVTHWFWFIGIGHYDRHPAKDSGQVLGRPNDQTGGIKLNTKFYYLKQIRATFELGANFYPTNSVQEKRMNWGYGQKPAITAAVARNPDGSWGIGVVNTTGIPDSSIAKFHPGAAYRVELRLPKEALGLSYQVYRSLSGGIFKWKVLAAPQGAVVELLVQPLELITLRSQ
jgi:hypothetical protein